VPSPVELHQIAYRAAADYFDGIESNVIERQVLARGAEKIVEAVLPYLCTEPVAPTESRRPWWRFW